MDIPDTTGKVTWPRGHPAHTGRETGVCSKVTQQLNLLIKHKTNDPSVEATNQDRIFPHLRLPNYAKQLHHP